MEQTVRMFYYDLVFKRRKSQIQKTIHWEDDTFVMKQHPYNLFVRSKVSGTGPFSGFNSIDTFAFATRF